MKVYTKTGDKGDTSLFGGSRVRKYDLRIESYGTADELNSWIGLIRDQEINENHKELLTDIQDRIFTLGSQLAADPNKPKLKMPHITEADIVLLENKMDEYNETLPEMTKFTLPGGNTTVSYCHIARCVCRRCERLVVELSDREEIPAEIAKYLNRLSDYLFVLGRKLTQELGAKEVFWEPKM